MLEQRALIDPEIQCIQLSGEGIRTYKFKLFDMLTYFAAFGHWYRQYRQSAYAHACLQSTTELPLVPSTVHKKFHVE